MYSVKAKPVADLLAGLGTAITHLRRASIADEAAGRAHACRRDTVLHAPGQADEAVLEAYWKYACRFFSLDIDGGVGEDPARDGAGYWRDAADLTLCVRLRVSSEHAKYSLASKFGVLPLEAKELLFEARQAADALGICFHVGSQAMTPTPTRRRWSACARRSSRPR
jgi:ornithine decarboxylase